MLRVILAVFVLSAVTATLPAPAAAQSGGYCSVQHECWQTQIQTQRANGQTTISFTVTPLCKNMSYVAFGFPAAATIGSPVNGATYTGPLTGLPFAVSIPAAGQVPGNAIKFQPGGALAPDTPERFVVTVEGLASDASITLYLHAGSGPTPVALPSAPNCSPNAVKLGTLRAALSLRDWATVWLHSLTR